MKTIINDIKSNTFQPVYLICGAESYLVRYYKNCLIKALGGRDSMNFHAFSGKDLPLNEIIDLSNTMPFFADKRLILVEDSSLFDLKGNGDPDGVLADYLKEVPETTVFLFVQPSVDKRTRLYKAIQKVGHICECGRQNDKYLERFISGFLGRNGRRITQQAMDLFRSRVGDDMELICQEMQKLLSYTEGRDAVLPEDVDAVCTEQLETKIYLLMNAIVEKKPDQALRLYREFTEQRESPMRILYSLVHQFQLLIQVGDLSSQGLRQNEIASRLGIKPVAARNCVAQCANFPARRLRLALSDCLTFEELFKNGRIDANIGLEMILIRYSGPDSSEEPLFSRAKAS